jgi:HEAT repeat protein
VSANSSNGGPATTPTAEKAIAPLSRAGWEPGALYAQTIDLKVGVGTNDQEEAGSGQHFQLRLGGKLETRVSEVRGSEVRVRLQLVEPKVEAGTAAVPAEVLRAFATPFFADYDARGRALRLHVAAGLDRTVQGILREIVSTTQLTTSEPAAARWSAVESDTAGDYKAAYQALGATRILRQKSEYVRLASTGGNEGNKPRLDIVAYSADFELDDWGRVKALKCTSKTNTTAGETGITFASGAELKLTTISRSRDTAGLPFSIAGLVATPIAPDASDTQDTTTVDRQLAAGADVKGILEGLTEAKDEGQTAAHARTRLAALFRLDPKAIKGALAMLDDANAPTILSGLGSAGTADAEKAVRDVLSDSRSSAAERHAAVDAVFGLEHPTAETAKALETLTGSDDPTLKQNASLALGVAASRLAEDDPETSAGVVQRLAAGYGSAPTSDEKIRIVGALGNARSSDSLKVLAQALASPDPAVRTAAAAALRFVADPAADGLLSKAMTSDPEISVRNAALMAAGYRAYDPLAQALETIAKDPDAKLRGVLVSTLTQMAQHDSQSLVLLDWIATNDPSSEVRSQAQGALGRAS